MKQNRLTINYDWLKRRGACPDGMEYWRATGKNENVIEICEMLLKDEETAHLEWLLAHVLSDDNRRKWIGFCWNGDDRKEHVIKTFNNKKGDIEKGGCCWHSVNDEKDSLEYAMKLLKGAQS